MAAKMRLLSGQLPRVAVCYNGGLKALGSIVQQQRGFATGRATDSGSPSTTVVFEAIESEVFAKSIEDKFGEQFRHFPLPGNVTTAQQYLKLKEKTSITLPKTASGLEQSDVMSTMTAHDRQFGTVQTFSEASRKLPPPDIAGGSSSSSMMVPSTLECAAQPCPDLARKHFADLFPGRDIQKGTLTVMTLAQRTEHDMSEWSERVDRERDNTMSQFVSTASIICEALQREGYWADFIDPTSGRPYLGPFTNATLFETDERYRNFGFSIEDLGCCKVILHPKWGTHAFVGSIFSDAPLDAPLLQKLLPQQQRAMIEPAAVIAAVTEGICPPDMTTAGGAACETVMDQPTTAEQQPPQHTVRSKVENGVDSRILKREDGKR